MAEEKKSGKFFSLNLGVNGGTFTPSTKGDVEINYTDGSQVKGNQGYKFEYGIYSMFADAEFTFEGYTTMIELGYANAELDEWVYVNDIHDQYIKFDETKFDQNIHVFSGMIFAGPIIFPKKRFQIPLLVGFGTKYYSGEPFDKLTIEFGYKARAKFYFSNRVGIFGGASGYWGFAGPKYFGDKKQYSATPVIHKFVYEAGLTIMLGRLK